LLLILEVDINCGVIA